MASILKRKRKQKTTYLVFIRRKGIKPIRKSFINKSDAQKWARGIERELDQGRYIDYLGNIIWWVGLIYIIVWYFF